MINLYQILHLSPLASEAEIRFALKSMEDNLDERTRKAVHEWLLVAHVRARYDAQLREAQPEFFAEFEIPSQYAEIETPSLVRYQKPKIVRKTAETANDDDYIDLAPLWNPKTILIGAILLNVVFGAILQAKNWEMLQERKLAQKNYQFAGCSLLIMSIMALFGTMGVNMFINLGLTIAWYQMLGKQQIAFFKQYFDDDYDKRDWILPIVLGLGAIIVWMIFMGILADIFGIA